MFEMDNKFRGNAYIIKSDEVLLNYSGGYADMANEIPNTLSTRFAIASMSKTFVAVGILQLIEAGKLRFEDTLGAILDIDLKSIDPGVTVKQLLNHTSGVPDYASKTLHLPGSWCIISEYNSPNFHNPLKYQALSMFPLCFLKHFPLFLPLPAIIREIFLSGHFIKQFYR